jgi:hypothetical protein
MARSSKSYVTFNVPPITYQLRAGTSICDRAAGANRHATANGALGMNAASTRKPFAGMWVKTTLRTSPIRRATPTASSGDRAESKPAQKKIGSADRK